jgi:hypothetical protein
MLDDDSRKDVDAALNKNCALLVATPTVKRNRLLADLTSFFMLCCRQDGYKAVIDRACHGICSASFFDLLERFSPMLRASFEKEIETKNAEDIKSLWDTWWKNIEIEKESDYLPSHIYFHMLDDDDWDSQHFQASAQFTVLAQQLFLDLT